MAIEKGEGRKGEREEGEKATGDKRGREGQKRKRERWEKANGKKRGREDRKGERERREKRDSWRGETKAGENHGGKANGQGEACLPAACMRVRCPSAGACVRLRKVPLAELNQGETKPELGRPASMRSGD